MSIIEQLNKTFNVCFYMQWLLYIPAKITKMYHLRIVSESMSVLTTVESITDSDSVMGHP